MDGRVDLFGDLCHLTKMFRGVGVGAVRHQVERHLRTADICDLLWPVTRKFDSLMPLHRIKAREVEEDGAAEMAKTDSHRAAVGRFWMEIHVERCRRAT